MRTLVIAALLITTTSIYAQTPDPNAGNQELTLQRFAVQGKKSILGSYYSLKMDCTPTEWQDVKILKAPDNGEAKLVENYPTFANYNPPNPRTKCNGEKIKATAMEYTPTKGYVGEDAIVAEVINDSGQRSVLKYAIVVK